MIKTLLKSSNYNGRYIAMKDFDDSAVIADGANPQEAYEKAIKKGLKNPVITFVPIKNMVQIY